MIDLINMKAEYFTEREWESFLGLIPDEKVRGSKDKRLYVSWQNLRVEFLLIRLLKRSQRKKLRWKRVAYRFDGSTEKLCAQQRLLYPHTTRTESSLRIPVPVFLLKSSNTRQTI